MALEELRADSRRKRQRRQKPQIKIDAFHFICSSKSFLHLLFAWAYSSINSEFLQDSLLRRGETGRQRRFGFGVRIFCATISNKKIYNLKKNIEYLMKLAGD